MLFGALLHSFFVRTLATSLNQLILSVGLVLLNPIDRVLLAYNELSLKILRMSRVVEVQKRHLFIEL